MACICFKAFLLLFPLFFTHSEGQIRFCEQCLSSSEPEWNRMWEELGGVVGCPVEAAPCDPQYDFMWMLNQWEGKVIQWCNDKPKHPQCQLYTQLQYEVPDPDDDFEKYEVCMALYGPRDTSFVAKGCAPIQPTPFAPPFHCHNARTGGPPSRRSKYNTACGCSRDRCSPQLKFAVDSEYYCDMEHEFCDDFSMVKIRRNGATQPKLNWRHFTFIVFFALSFIIL